MEDLKKKYGDEQVLVIETRNFGEDEHPLTYYSKIDYYGFFMDRCDAEVNPNFKQIIPYVVIKNGDLYYITKRLAGDSRLTGRYSIGQGGHINPCDKFTDRPFTLGNDMVLNCVKRELLEETNYDEEQQNSLTADFVFIDDSDDVSKVHACIMFVLDTNQNIAIKETDKLEGGWYSEDEITQEMFDNFENWSKIAYEQLFGRKKPKKVTKKKAKTVKEDTVE